MKFVSHNTTIRARDKNGATYLDVAIEVAKFLKDEIERVPGHGEFEFVLRFFVEEADEFQLGFLGGFSIFKFLLCNELFLFAGPDAQTWCGVMVFECFWHMYGSMLGLEVKEFLIAELPFEFCRGVRWLIFAVMDRTQLRQLWTVNRGVSTLPIIGELRLIALPAC